jgi:hypothetical protein
MPWIVRITVVAFLAGAAISVGVLTLAWRRREAPGGPALIGMMAAVCAWSLPAALELAATGIPDKVLLSKMSYVGIVGVPIAYLVFALQVTLSERRRWATATFVLAVPALAFLGIVFTNEWHRLVWPTLTRDPETGLLHYGHGPAFFATFGYLIATAIVASTLLVINAWRTRGPYRAQAVVVVAAAVLPLATTSLYAAGVSPLPNVDLTPGAFALAGLLLVLSLTRFRMLDLVPVAKERVFERLADAVLIFDDQQRLVDANPAAAALFGADAVAVGRPPRAPLDGWLRAAVDAGPGATAEIQAGYGARRLDVRVFPVLGPGPHSGGRILLARDVSRQRKTEQDLVDAQDALQARVRELEQVLGEVRTLQGLLPICAYCKRVRNDQDYWQQIDSYVATHTDVRFSHGICPDCYARVAGDLDDPADKPPPA